MTAVKQDGYALEYVHNQTEAICLAAVKQNVYALRYVHNKTEAICLAAVRQDASALQYVLDKKLFHKLALRFKIEIEEGK